MFKEQVLLLALDQNGETVAGKNGCFAVPAGRKSRTASMANVLPSAQVIGLGLHIASGIKVRVDFDVDPFHVRR